MNPNPPPDDPALNRLLRQWMPAAPLPPRFQERVWQRIEHAGDVVPLWCFLRDWLVRQFARQVAVAGYLGAVVVLGAAVGWVQGRVETHRITVSLQERYAHAVDPYHVAAAQRP
ncbi:MAG: hypothetical protein HC841_05980 [Verrucomicrobiae bacterium]|nr:hypothetical protein [Verrucomicrobiae bacterium]